MKTGDEIITVPVPPLTDEKREDLQEDLKRCSEATRKAVFEFLETGRVDLLPTIVKGIVERFLEPEMRPKLQEGDGSLRLVDDLGIDSLTMMEIVVLAEEAFGISIDNEELRDLRSIDDVIAFMDAKVKGQPVPQKDRHYGIEAVVDAIPHSLPFVFINEADLNNEEARGTYQITGEEPGLEGHFPGNPVFPASLMLEALGQLAVLHLTQTQKSEEEAAVDQGRILFTGCETVRVQRICKPGDSLNLQVKLKKQRHPLAIYEGKITCGDESVAWAEDISLTFDWVGGSSNEAATEES